MTYPDDGFDEYAAIREIMPINWWNFAEFLPRSLRAQPAAGGACRYSHLAPPVCKGDLRGDGPAVSEPVITDHNTFVYRTVLGTCCARAGQG